MYEFDVARKAAQIGGEIVAKYFREGVTIRNKGRHNLVSDADIDSEKAIVAFIREAFPDHDVLAEELHQQGGESEHLWVIDPLDGTNNFAHAVPHFAVSVAYYRHGRPECGVVWNPIRDDWYTAIRGQGAWHNDCEARVSNAERLDDVLVGVGFYYDRGAMMEATLSSIRDLFTNGIHGIRRFGTAALDLCQVGTGLFGAFFEYELAPWDFGAGTLFVTEAGGQITDCRGAELPLQRSSLLASNGQLHQATLDIVSRHAGYENRD